MHITKQALYPSRDDAVRMTRNEKLAMLQLSYIATVFDELQNDLKDRLKMIGVGTQRMQDLAAESENILNDLRLTVPMNQRMSLQNVASDYEMRLAPKATPFTTRIIMEKEEFRELVDFARIKCRECVENDEDCQKCQLFQLLTSILPMDEYKGGMFCPYNLGEWGN